MLQSRGAADAGMVDLSDSHALLSVDGYKAWAVVKGLFGADVLGLPYLSVERYEFGGQPLSLFRAGKTSEFGYYLLAPAANAADLFDKCLSLALENKGGLCGVDIHNDLRLEGRFFNIFAEGATVRDPLPLGLQWMIDFGKESFLGSTAIFERRAKGLSHKIIGVSAAPGVRNLAKGAAVYNGTAKAGEIVASCFSYVLNAQVGLALLPVDIAFAGLTFNLGAERGPELHTISMPPIMPKSLTVKLDEL
jgi:aminomethyltransferase